MLLRIVFGCMLLCLVAAEQPHNIWSAPFTAYNENGLLAYNVIEQQVIYHKSRGVNRIWAVGGMADWDQLTTDERMHAAEEWVRASKKHNVTITIHVGSFSLYTARDLAAHAEKIGADMIAMVPPPYQKPSSIASLIECLKFITSGAPNTPFLYYHIPGATGVNLNMFEFLQAAATELPMLRGLKFVDNDHDTYMRCVNFSHSLNDRFEVIWAVEPKLSALPLGARSVVLAEAIYGPYWIEVRDAFLENDLPRALAAQQRDNLLHDIVSSYGGARYVMKMSGVDLGPPRLPNHPMTPAKYSEFQKKLTDFGFFKQ